VLASSRRCPTPVSPAGCRNQRRGIPLKRLLTVLLLADALLLLGAATAWASAPVFESTVVAPDLGPAPAFAESLTVDSAGDLRVSLMQRGDVTRSGEVWRLGPDGERTAVASLDVGPGPVSSASLWTGSDDGPA
jgi:hypothetical protein